ncbi:hypothetical protein DFH27DRAFT_487716 [Peziza echinospora]|nr:hypothetical protein DFH27DRAFT_487716 [Peziza echinospora]
MATIKPIEGRSVHQIQSGQVIGDGLTSAVKELVENSLDAHATSIEVRFKNYGLDAIEVCDNGDGISKENYESIALKHYTSKLTTYDDLENVSTFGFRGEALSSLCALSVLSILTATKEDAPKGSKLEFEISGKLKNISIVAAQKGTTVISENLFNSLPVRRKELERNVKREYTKVLGFLQAYASISTGVKFTVFNTPPKGKKTLVFSTKANPTTRENISNVFGAKSLVALVPLDLEFEMQSSQRPPVMGNWTKKPDESKTVRILGHISKPVVGEGRLAPDRQMFFVNQRPCNLPQVSRAFNEVYKQFNMTQSPFIFADLQMDTNAYDVNVSPDKRTILLHDQNELLESLKASLTELFNNHEQHVPHTQLGSQMKPSGSKIPTLSRNQTASSQIASSPPNYTQAAASVDEEEEPEDIISASSPTTSTPQTQFINIRRETYAESSTEVPSLKSIVERANSIQYSSPDKGKMVGEAPSSPPPSHLAGSYDEDDYDEDENDIPLRSSPGPAGPFERMAQFRKSQSQLARDVPTTITIGKTTITSPMSSPARKKQRVDNRPTVTFDKSSSSFKLFSAVRNLAAPGTKVSFTGSQKKDEEEESMVEEGNNDDDEIEEYENELPRPERLRTKEASDVEMDYMDEMDDQEDVLQSQLEAEQESLFLPGAEDDFDDDEEQQVEAERDNQQQADEPINPEDEEYIDEEELRVREKRKVERLIEAAEETSSAKSHTANLSRAETILRGRAKHSIKGRTQIVSIGTDSIKTLATKIHKYASEYDYMHNLHDDLGGVGGDGKDKSTEQSAEERLTLTISKSDFSRMRIIGQFNRGFIITTRSNPPTATTPGSEDLFIIDQHASDEKYNFETLQATTIMRSQPLVRPKTLDLMAMDEEIVKDNIHTLKANGFSVDIDEDAPCGQKCRLLTLPMSENTIFDLKDLEELIHLMSLDGAGTSSDGGFITGKGKQTVVRPSKVRKTFAMRACRSSVMVGKALTREQMGKIVKHMGELDKPWNCPHGRPTMRHLCELTEMERWRGEGGCLWGGEWWRDVLEDYGGGEDGGEDEDGDGDEEGEGEGEGEGEAMKIYED